MIAQDRPLCFFDLESTGINPAEDRIVEVCILRREIDGRETFPRDVMEIVKKALAGEFPVRPAAPAPEPKP